MRRLKKLVYKKSAMELREKFKEIIKPKPRFMPWFVWKFLTKLLLDTEL